MLFPFFSGKMAETRRQTLKACLDDLECPAKWKPHKDGSLRGLQELHEHLIQGALDCPYMAVAIYSLLAHIYTLSGEGQYKNLEKAGEWAAKAINEANKPLDKYLRRSHATMDRSFVPRAIMAHVHFCKDETKECQNLVS